MLLRIREHFGLSDSEARLILDDVVWNLEALVADLPGHPDRQGDLGKSPQRIMQALGSLAEQLECGVFAEILGRLSEAGAAEGLPLSEQTLEPLSLFVQGLRQAMPPVSRGHGNWPGPAAASHRGHAAEPH